MSWTTKRKPPYTLSGIRRMKCIRCGAKAGCQWTVCSDNNNHRPLCLKCDVALNALVLNWMKHPRARELMLIYTQAKIECGRVK